jgi:glycosyltransferase involved in cell wall biosynthesis
VLRRLESERFVPDVLSLQNLMFYPFVREFPKAVLHYRMTDRMDAFGDYPASMLAYERRVLDEADIISITSKQFMSLLGPEQQARAFYAPNGVDVEHFSRPRPRPAAYADTDGPIVVYVGALRDWFDWDLLRDALRAAPRFHAFVISPDAPRADLLGEPRFTYIPGVPYEEVPAYYQHATVTVIPFRDSPLVAPVNPIKMYESLAAGTPVAANSWAELRELGAPVIQAEGAASLAQAFRASGG